MKEGDSWRASMDMVSWKMWLTGCVDRFSVTWSFVADVNIGNVKRREI